MPEDRPAQDSGVAAAAGPAAGGSHVAVGGGGQYDSDTGSEEPATALETVRERRLRELQLQVQRHQDIDNTHTHTHTHTRLTARFSGTTRVSRYQKGNSSLDFTEARESEWHQLGHMQVCT